MDKRPRASEGGAEDYEAAGQDYSGPQPPPPPSAGALGELLLDALPLACASGFALDLRRARHVCGATFRLGAPRADGSLDTRGFKGGTADMIKSALRLQAPWLEAARAAAREEHKDVARTTRLMRAADAGDERHVRELLAAGARADLASERGLALHWAAAAGHARVVEVLLDGAGGGTGSTDGGSAGAGIDLVAGRGSPLMLASVFGREEVVRLLLARGASQALRNEAGNTALHVAISFDRPRVVELLCDGPGGDAALALKNGRGRTPLAYATWNGGRRDMIAALRARGAPE